ncbi:MAG: AAA family ATPase [bacterium]|nr:AAA family ATPase [bacterium]MDT8367093.1 AAA family ATPase [bacterium]
MTIPTQRIIKELSRPEAYPHPVDKVEVIQTHISVVFLAGDLVYKVKKPLNLGFLDFTTLEKRHHYCLEELRLNRRLSPDIYLYVVPVVDGPNGLRFGVTGDSVEISPVEYAVVMKRLDESRFLSALLTGGTVDRAAMRSIAERIADFHLQAETSAEITRVGGIEAVILNTEEDFQQVQPYVGETLSIETYETIALYTRTFIEVNRDLFARREAGGWIRDGHGDLHTQHICMADGFQIFDCIEFNERFRYGDVLADAAFLAMDLERLGYRDLAQTYTDSYLELMELGDFSALFNFYACYRAVVRGKVEGFRSRDPNVLPAEANLARENARNFFSLAEKYARTPVPPVLITGCGLMGSGKSTLAKALESRLDIVILSSDSIRKELAGIDPTSSRHVPFGSDIYSEEFSIRTYSQLHKRATTHLKGGQSVFLDGSYMNPDLREQALEAARKADAGFLLLHLDPGEEELRNRLRKRMKGPDAVSDGREEILGDQIAAFSPPAEVPHELKLTFHGSQSLDDLARETYRRLLAG